MRPTEGGTSYGATAGVVREGPPGDEDDGEAYGVTSGEVDKAGGYYGGRYGDDEVGRGLYDGCDAERYGRAGAVGGDSGRICNRGRGARAGGFL